MGPESLIKHVATAHTRICFSSVSPLQEAVAVAFEEADSFSFWETSKGMIKKKMDKFNQIWDELGLPYTKPDGGYFVLVNLNKVNLPEDYPFPSHIAERPRDFQLSYFLINELGVVAVPPTEFYTQENAHYVQNYLRFSVCQSDELLDEAHQRLRGLRKYICS